MLLSFKSLAVIYLHFTKYLIEFLRASLWPIFSCNEKEETFLSGYAKKQSCFAGHNLFCVNFSCIVSPPRFSGVIAHICDISAADFFLAAAEIVFFSFSPRRNENPENAAAPPRIL